MVEKSSISTDVFDPKRTALVVIDMQNDFCSEKGAYGRSGGSTQPVKEMARRLEGFLKIAREIRTYLKSLDPSLFFEKVHPIKSYENFPKWSL